MRQFKTESKRLLDLMINSIYTNKEIFLRELISNSSDALDKLWMTALTNKDKSIQRSDLAIEVAFDNDARTITISDNGIGMTKDELINNLGTIAHSGSLDFKNDESFEKNDEIDIIGQFGVGFYSSFMVADEVEVVSRAYGSDEAYAWKSDGEKGYTVEEASRDSHGTTVTLHIRPSNDDNDFDAYLREYKLESLIKRYSDYVRYPIKMEKTEHREKPRPEDADDDYTPEYESVKEVQTINSMVPIWTRKKADVTDEEYNEFFKAQFHETSDPAAVISLHAEGGITYDALLFIPSEASQDLYSKDFEKGLALYSSGVLIMEKCADLLPDCFGFVKGVVDSADLNLNISRETLQQDRQLQAIARKIERKIKTELMKMRDNDREKYESVFKEFGHAFKYGIYSSFGGKKDLLEDLLLFYSAKEERNVTLEEYEKAAAVAAAAKGDAESDAKAEVSDAGGEDSNASAASAEAESEEAGTQNGKIYFATGGTVTQLSRMPIVKTVMDKGYDVLLCTDAIDEFCLMSMNGYEEARFVNVAGGDLDLDDEEEKHEAEKVDTDNADLFGDMAAALDGKVTKVTASTMLGNAAACITADGPVSIAMEKYFKKLPNADEAPKAEHVLEINPNTEVFSVLQKAFEGGDTEKVKAYTQILHDQALLAEGLEIEDPIAFNEAVCKLMK